MWNTEILGYKTTIRVDWLLNVCPNLIPDTLKERAKNIKSLPRNCPRVHIQTRKAGKYFEEKSHKLDKVPHGVVFKQKWTEIIEI